MSVIRTLPCVILLLASSASAFLPSPPTLRHASPGLPVGARHASAGLRGGLRMVEGEEKKKTMQRPLGDNIVTQAIYTAEMARVKLMSETPTEENNNWSGEPRAWAEDSSVAQKVSEISQVGPFASFKQWIAQSIAGDYDSAAINKRIDDAISGSPVVMFSFTTCPFCLKSKQLLLEDIGIDASKMVVIECDEDEEGNAIRAELGKRTGRTSMPSVWVKGQGYLGGCNDGPGVVPLHKEEKLVPMLEAAGAFPATNVWSMLTGALPK